MHLCTCVSEEGGDGESAGSEALSLLSYTLRYVSLTDLDRLQRQQPETQEKFNNVINVILTQTDFWKNLDLCCKVLEPVLQDLSVSDGMKGGTPTILNSLNHLCLGLDKMYSDPIDGLDESIRIPVHGVVESFTFLYTILASSWTRHFDVWSMTTGRQWNCSKS